MKLKIDYQDGLPTDFDNVDSDVIVIGQGRFIIDYLKGFPQTLFEMPKKKRMAQS